MDSATAAAPAATDDTSGTALSCTLNGHLIVVDKFERRLNDLIATGRDYGGLASRLKARVARSRDWITGIPKNGHIKSGYVDHEGRFPPWAVEARQLAPLKLVLTGPAPNDSVEVEAVDEEEANWILGENFMDTLGSNCRHFMSMETQIFSLAQIHSQINEARAKLSVGVSPETIIENRKRLLGEYNEMKDIGQQLIGLIAENRGVTIGTLYENGDYGVTADD
ncbi:Swi5-domain-containing protein [Podospora aff. communis PSN243]|uniref:Swi5-domain-containing protein n=1 Tax=Podospora aff. communis PSN243 TaxID=3040156 RepID=A0AAV9GS05_9PEZI|nr:Swi5-domain-containing protein [Podospora aff. communis PSN243]